MNISLSSDKILRDIFLHCMVRHRDQMTQLYSCLDTKRDEIDQHTISLRGKEMEEGLISDSFLLAFDTYATTVLAFIGIFLNILGCYQILSRPERKKMFNLMLAPILVFDTIYLAFKLMRSLKPYIPIPDEGLLLYYTIANSGIRFSLTSSTLMMVAIGRVRYHAVKKPILQRTLLFSRKKRIQLLLQYLVPTLILSVTFTYPILFEIDDTSTNLENDNVKLSPSNIRLSPLYSFFVLGILNFVLLGLLPFACLVYFAYKIILYTHKRRVENRYAPNVVRMMDETMEKVSKSCVMIIIVFITLHSLRIVTSVGEFYVLTRKNKDVLALKLGLGVPMWLQALAPISELCTVVNACLNIVVYRYITSSGVLRYCPACVPSCFHNIDTAEISRSLPTASVPRPNTPVEEQESRHSSTNVMNVEVSSPMVSISRNSIATEENASNNSSNGCIRIDVINQRTTFHVRRQGHEWI